MNSHTIAHFVDPGTMAGLWSALSFIGGLATLLLGSSVLFC